MKKSILLLLTMLALYVTNAQTNLNEHVILTELSPTSTAVSFDNSPATATINQIDELNATMNVGRNTFSIGLINNSDGSHTINIPSLITFTVNIDNSVRGITLLTSERSTAGQCLQNHITGCNSSWLCSIMCKGNAAIYLACLAGWVADCAIS